jgi:hypothetical protein
MRLTLWWMIALVGLAGALVAAVALASSAPASCSDAKGAHEGEMLAEAGKQYVALLGDEPDNECARRGLIETQHRRCDLAKRLIQRERLDDAEKLLLGALNTDPSLLLLAERDDDDGDRATKALECVEQQLTGHRGGARSARGRPDELPLRGPAGPPGSQRGPGAPG